MLSMDETAAYLPQDCLVLAGVDIKSEEGRPRDVPWQCQPVHLHLCQFTLELIWRDRKKVNQSSFLC